MRFNTSARGLALGIATLCTTGSFALDYTVQRATTAPTIDGAGTDAIWAQASPAMTNFVQHNAPGTVANQQTSVRLLWDDEKLYMLFEAEDSEIVAPMTANHTDFDFGTPQDTAEIFLDPSLRQTTGGNDYIYHIAVNPDENAYIYSEAGQNQTGWVPGPESEFAFTSEGTNWKVEMALSWADLNSTYSFSPGVLAGPPPTGAVWGMQLGRLHSPGTTNVAASKWQPTSGFFRVRPFGTIKFAGPPNEKGVDLSTKTELLSTSFEASEGFTAGVTPDGVNDWTISSDPSRFIITTDQASDGDQSIEMTAGTAGRTLSFPRQTTNTETAQYLQYAVRPSADFGTGSSPYRHVLYVYGEYEGGNDRPTSIWLYSSPSAGANRVNVFDYENGTTTTATTVNYYGILAFEEWNYITLKLDPVSKTFEVWINDIKLQGINGTDQFTIKRADAFKQFTYASFYSPNSGSTSSYLDEVIVAEDPISSNVSDWNLY